MSEIIAYCGLSCSDCPAYIATQEDDNAKRKETAETWSQEFNADIKPEDINCDGCLSNERVFRHCNVCEIRKCAREKDVMNCAHCDEYACEKLSEFFEMVPDTKERLDAIRKNL